MFATSVRERPCSALSPGRSDGRETMTLAPSIFTDICECSVRLSSPFGPFTCTVLPSILTVTPAGTATGSFPIRDMVGSLPDEGEEFAAGALRARLAVGHQALRRAEDRHAEAVADARDLGGADIVA